MVNILYVFIIVFFVTIVGGSVGYFIWVKTRPKKETWNAIIYEASEGTRQEGTIEYNDLIPYGKDIIEKIEHPEGGTIYKLKKINKPLPGVDGNIVEYWGPGLKNVYILKQNDTYTTLKRGFDGKKGLIYQPMPHSKVNLIKSEIILRKTRIRKEKDILEAIAPWIIFGIGMMAMIGMIYISIEGFVRISANLNEAAASNAGTIKLIREMGCGYQSSTTAEVGIQPEKTYPLVEGG